MRRCALGTYVGLLLVALVPAISWSQSLRLQVESRDEIYAELPFVLALSAKGFEEEPSPAPPPLAIEGCRVTYLGVTPNVAQRIQIVNGQRSEWRDVTFVYRWRVEASASGSYIVPGLTVAQGDKRAESAPASFSVREIEATDDMIVRMDLPERTLWVGETFEAAVEWLLRRDVGDYEFVVPLFELDRVQVESPAADRERTLTFRAGARDIDLPIAQDSVELDGARYSRFRFRARVTVTRPGPLELEPVRVVASLETGTGRDSFGFPRAVHRRFKAQGERRSLVVRALPQENRPASFVNAIGSGFSIGVQASQTVVRVGDPIDLQIRIRGDGPLEGLTLPRLDVEGGLSGEHFSVPNAAAVGVIDTQANAKVFDVTVRVRSAEAREIPPLTFSYFDPARGEYATARSQPIALSVAASDLVDAGDVTAAPNASSATDDAVLTPSAAVGDNTLVSLIGADMSLSSPSGTLRRTWNVAEITPVLLLLYLLPLLILAARIWMVATREKRNRRRTLRQALRDVEQALDSGAPAREAAPRVVNAMRALARAADREQALRSPVLAQLETQAFDPHAAQSPLDGELARSVRSLAREWTRDAQTPAGAIAMFVVACVAAWTPGGEAQSEAGLALARETYQAALQAQDRMQRTRLFAQAERQYRELAAVRHHSPELLTDWGNAALGAQDIGLAALAYRRALLAEPSHERASKNLAWLRDRAPTWLPRPNAGGPLDAFFFWHTGLSVAQRHLIGAIAFGVGLLLLAPWSASRARLLRRLAVPALVVWIAATGSALLAADSSRAAVVLTDGTVLRSADSLGAQPALAKPLPSGTELQILEIRDAWKRVALADGTRGWVPASTIATVGG